MKMHQYREMLRQILQSNLSSNAIGKALGISPHTVRKGRKLVKEQNWSWEDLQQMDDLAIAGFFQRVRGGNTEKVTPEWSHIHQLMQKKHQTLIQLWEEYRETYQTQAYSYSQFTYYYREYLSKVDITMRQTHYAGEVLYVDYAGKTMRYYDAAKGEYRKVHIFVGVLGCSNYTFAWASHTQSIPDWIEAHNQMFQCIGGVPCVVVPDNLKSAVIKPGNDPVLNKTYKELAEHYGFVIVPARVRRPQDKSKAEIGVKLITQWITVPLSRRQFFSLDEINQAIAELLPAFNQRPFKRFPGCRQSRFEEMDKPALKSLPDRPYEYGEWISAQKVAPDYHIYVKGHAYSVPHRLVTEKVTARVSTNSVELFHLGIRVATHLRDDTQGEATTDPNHRPVSHQAYATQDIQYFLEWATGIGESTMGVVKAQFNGRPDYAVAGRKSCSQLQSLCRQYGKQRMELACARSLKIASPTVKSIRSILQHNLDQELPSSSAVLTEIPEHNNLRGAGYYN